MFDAGDWQVECAESLHARKIENQGQHYAHPETSSAAEGSIQIVMLITGRSSQTSSRP